MNRRRFLTASLMSTTLALSDARPKHAGSPRAGGSFAVLEPFAPGAITPEGWVRGWLTKQAQHLGIALPSVCQPFQTAYWAGDERPDPEGGGWWPWEQKAYWIDGSLRCGLVLGDRKLLAAAAAPVEYTLSHAASGGYLGPAAIADPGMDFCRWPHTVFFRALAAYADARGDTGAVHAVCKHYLSDTTDYGSLHRNATNIEAMIWAYQHCGDDRLLALAEKTWAVHLRHAGEDDQGDMRPSRVFGHAPIHSHGVTFIEIAKLPAILYIATGKQEYLEFALAQQRRIFDRYMLVDGIPSTSEYYASTTSRDVHETCDIADHTWSWSYLLRATGDGIWADRIERACFNAGFGAVRKDWRGIQYLSCPNQMIATPDSSHIPNSGGGSMAYQPNPGGHVACCAGNAHRIFPNYAIHMWMRTADGLAATLYGPSRLRTTMGNQALEIVQTTGYPFDDRIEFTVRPAAGLRFALSLRIPRWSDAPRIFLNDRAAPLPEPKNGFTTVTRTWAPGDKLTLVLPMAVSMTRWPEGGVAIEHGPLVYSLGIRENWTSRPIPGCSSAEFPSWSASAATPWNYGLAIEESKLRSQTRFERKPPADDPWVDPPVELVAPVREISGWKLAFDPNNPERKFSPPLPTCGHAKYPAPLVPPRDFNPGNTEPVAVTVAHFTEMATLVPLGSTHLRVTILPDVSRAHRS